jgi:hypothetical protein
MKQKRNTKPVRALLIHAAATALFLAGWPAVADEPPAPRREVADLLAEVRENAPRAASRAVDLDLVSGRDRLGPVLAPPIADALAWLEAAQDIDGSWGDALPLTQTASVLETLPLIDACSPALEPGATWLAAQTAANHEFLARQTIALSGVPDYEDEVAGLAVDLLALRNPAEFDGALPNWPEGGWGLAPGYETDCLTTALALEALARTGYNGGFAVNDAAIPGGATDVYAWEIPADAPTVRILITVAGSEVRLRMTEGAPPTIFDPYFPLPPGGPYLIVFPDSGLPFTPGTNYVSIESPDPPALAATYTLSASYQTPDFDTRTLAEPLDYLRQSQNLDGGWGLQRGGTSEPYTTLHVLQALESYAQYDLDGELASGIAHLKAQQLAGGSFGYGGVPISYVTALALLDLVRAEDPPFSTETDEAATALSAMQSGDGSWDQQAYDTALAMLALWRHGLPPTADAGVDPVLTDVDGNCVENVTLSGAGSAVGGSIVDYQWAVDCVPLASGATPTVPMAAGVHTLVLTVTDDAGLTATDEVTVTVGTGAQTVCIDGDGDEVLDDGDGSGTAGDAPCPTGLPLGCDDNCLATFNPDQADLDADGSGDVCDCDAGNGLIWAQPGQASLSLSHSVPAGETTLDWTPGDPGAVSPFFDTLRSTDASDFVNAALCLESDQPDTSAVDTDLPAAGALFYYLVRAENDCPGPGSLGTDSSGTERTGPSCP